MTDSKITLSIERVYIGFFQDDGSYLGAYRRAARVKDCRFWQGEGTGIRVAGTDHSFIQAVFAQNAGDGVFLNQGQSLLWL